MSQNPDLRGRDETDSCIEHRELYNGTTEIPKTPSAQQFGPTWTIMESWERGSVAMRRAGRIGDFGETRIHGRIVEERVKDLHRKWDRDFFELEQSDQVHLRAEPRRRRDLLHAKLSAESFREGAPEYDSLVQVARDTYIPLTTQTVMLMYRRLSPLPLFRQLHPKLTHHSMSATYQSTYKLAIFPVQNSSEGP
eukprot:6198448-Pleurochrysis_carterae.AAC.1